MSEHTPGPWNIHASSIESQPFIVTPDDGQAPWVAFQQWVASGNKIVCTTSMQTGKGGWPNVESVEEAKANARLMAAAPELLQALKEIVKNCDDGFAVILGSLVEQGRAAIAKAEGKQ